MDRVPEDFYEKQIQDELQALIDDIVDGASNLAGSSGTRTNTKGKIYAECENVKNALTDLLDEFSQVCFIVSLWDHTFSMHAKFSDARTYAGMCISGKKC